MATVDRRGVVLGAGAALLGAGGAAPFTAEPMAEGLRLTLRALERRHGGRLGVAILWSGPRGTVVTQRGEERFPFCSTYKVLAAAAVLARVDRGMERLERLVPFGAGDLVPYSPASELHAGQGMTLGALCEAAVGLSDNTAGNLLLDSLGGPAALTAFLRGLGDGVSRLDRRELELNEAANQMALGDERDTTTPAAFARVLDKLVLGAALTPASRARLAEWMTGSRTGGRRIRAGVPAGWRVGDKTGSGAHGVTNDVAVLWPPNGAVRVVVALYAGAAASDAERDAVLAEVGRAAAG